MSDWKMKGKPALLVMHMQHEIVGEGSEENPGNAKVVRDAGIIPRQQALLKAFRERKLPVIYVNAMSHPLDCPLPAYGLMWRAFELTKPKLPKAIEVIPELTPQPGEPVLTNWLFNPFNNSGLEQVLKVCGAETLVLTGFATNGAVYLGASGAADRYYSVIVPSDTCTSLSVRAHETVLEVMAPMIALVTTAEDVIAHL